MKEEHEGSKEVADHSPKRRVRDKQGQPASTAPTAKAAPHKLRAAREKRRKERMRAFDEKFYLYLEDLRRQALLITS